MNGPMFLAVLALAIANTGRGGFTPTDFGYLAVMAGLILARWQEFRGGRPETASGEPATPGHLRRYAPAVVLIGAGVWVAVNLVGDHWLVRQRSAISTPDTASPRPSPGRCRRDPHTARGPSRPTCSPHARGDRTGRCYRPKSGPGPC